MSGYRTGFAHDVAYPTYTIPDVYDNYKNQVLNRKYGTAPPQLTVDFNNHNGLKSGGYHHASSFDGF
jgi:hypothetical protein